jgi:flagellar export protein FliJ
MKKYSFRLETVRRVRRTQEKLAKNDLLIANTEVQHAIEAVESRLGDYAISLESAPSGTLAVDKFMKLRYFNDLAGQAVVAARVSHANAMAEADTKRVAYTESARKVKTLDRLDSRSREEYDVETNRALDAETDDIVTGRHRRSIRLR